MKENENSTRRWEILRGEDGVVQYEGFVEGHYRRLTIFRSPDAMMDPKRGKRRSRL